MYQPPQGNEQPTYQTPPHTQYTPYPPPPQPPRRKTPLWIWIVVLVTFGIIVTQLGRAALTPSSDTTSTTTTAPTDTPISTSAPADTPTPAKPLTWTTVQTFKGSGSKKTQTFTIGDNWRIKWSCDPHSFGGTAFNVIIEVDNADGSIADLPVNTMCKPGNTSDTSYESIGGMYSLNVTSEGDWTIAVQTQQ